MVVRDKIKSFFRRSKPQAKAEQPTPAPKAAEKKAPEAPQKKTGESSQKSTSTT